MLLPFFLLLKRTTFLFLFSCMKLKTSKGFRFKYYCSFLQTWLLDDSLYNIYIAMIAKALYLRKSLTFHVLHLGMYECIAENMLQMIDGKVLFWFHMHAKSLQREFSPEFMSFSDSFWKYYFSLMILALPPRYSTTALITYSIAPLPYEKPGHMHLFLVD